MTVSTIPRAYQVLEESPLGRDSDYFKPKYLTRGALTHAGCGIIGRGDEIEEGWWRRSSGDPRTRGTLKDNFVAHEECRPYIEAYRAWMRNHGWHPEHFELEVKSLAGPYICHPDQIGYFQHKPDQMVLLELKNGDEEKWHRLQTALQRHALISSLKIIARRAVLYLPSARLVWHDDPQDIPKAMALVHAWHVSREFRG